MSLSNQKKMDKKNASPKRRAIIKGSATAMPMVLTLNSGSAFAALSTIPICNTQRPATHPPTMVRAGDGWTRTITKGRYYSGIGLVYLDPRSSNPEKWYQVHKSNVTGAPFITKTKDDGSTVLVVEFWANNPDVKEYIPESNEFPCLVLVHLTPEGKFSGVIGRDSSGALPFMTSSCYNSVIQAIVR